MPVHECLRKTPYRHFLAWMYKLDVEWNQPSRSDHYLMQLDSNVRRANAKHPRSVKMADSKLEFQLRHERAKKLTREAAAKASKSRWCMAVGIDEQGEPLPNIQTKYRNRRPQNQKPNS